MTKGERNKDNAKKGERNKKRERKLFKIEHTNRGSKLMNHLLHLNVH